MSFQIEKIKLDQKFFESYKKTSYKVQNVQSLVNEMWCNNKLQAKSYKALDYYI